MNKQHKLLFLVGLGGVLGVLSVFGLLNLLDGTNETTPITIGFVGPLTGDVASYGEPISNAVKLAVREINEAGGVNGQLIEVIYEDGQCSGQHAADATQKLVNIHNVSLIIGGICSSEALAMLPITEPAHVLVLSPTASSPDLSGAGEYFLRNNPSDTDGGKVLAAYVKNAHHNVAIISEQTDFAEAYQAVFVEEFESLGGTVVAREFYTPDTNDFRSLLAKISVSGADAVMINPQSESSGGILIKQAREMGFSAQLYGTTLASGSKTLEVAGVAAEGMILVSAPALPEGSPKVAKFLASYEQSFGQPTLEFYLGAAYDDVYLLAQAIAHTGTAEDTKAIVDYLHALTEYEGVIGRYRFDDQGDLSGIVPTMQVVRDGKVVPLTQDTILPATGQ